MTIGHNSGIAADQLRQYIERVERVEEEKANLSADIREIYAEAKGNGFDPKIMRQIIALRKLEAHERQEREAILSLYLTALGMKAQGELFDDSPLPAGEGQGEG
jgi:uncharacterized protein (UPF0335 family)